jgi:hypothetical protein
VPLKDNPGTLNADVQIKGHGSNPSLVGTLQFHGVNAVADQVPLHVETATLLFPADSEKGPTLDLVASGQLLTSDFRAYCSGPLSYLVRWFVLPPPLNESLVWNAMSGQSTDPAAPIGAPLSLEAFKETPLQIGPLKHTPQSTLNLEVPAAARTISLPAWASIATPAEPTPEGNAPQNIPQESQSGQ